jgi:hypothetical protein
MSNATPSRLGQVNSAGDVKSLFLKVFTGEVMTTFAETNVVLPYVRQRSIANGKSASFAIVGKAQAAYHVPGAEIVGKNIAANEVVITIDDLLIADSFISNIDEAMNHYDVRSVYSTELGRVLANTLDRHLLQLGLLAARASARITGETGGTTITAAGATSQNLIDALFDAAQVFDEKDVAMDDRVAFVRPAEYYSLAQNTTLLNKDWGGAGAYADGTVLRVAGITLVKTNHLPAGVIADGSLNAGTSNKYAGDFTGVKALVMQKGAIGSVKLMDLAMESEYDMRRQGSLMLAKYAMGHGVLAPQAAIEIKVA